MRDEQLLAYLKDSCSGRKTASVGRNWSERSMSAGPTCESW